MATIVLWRSLKFTLNSSQMQTWGRNTREKQGLFGKKFKKWFARLAYQVSLEIKFQFFFAFKKVKANGRPIGSYNKVLGPFYFSVVI